MRTPARPLLALVAAAVPFCAVGTVAASTTPSDPPADTSVPADSGAGSAGSITVGAVDPTTPDGLAAAAELSAATPSRFEMFMEISGMPGMPSLGDGDTPLVSGEIDGTSSRVVMDLSSLLGGISVGGSDWSMEMITIGQDLYMRAPFFGEIADLAGDATGPLAELSELGDGWGYIDGEALGATAGDVGAALGASTGDPGAFYAAIATTSKVEPLGTETIRGVESTGVRALVDFAAIAEAQKLDASTLPGGAAAYEGLQFPVEVWVGDDGYVSRITLEFDGETLAAAADASGESVPADAAAIEAISITTTIESFDYAADDIAIEAPTDFVDITEAFGELLAEGQTQMPTG